jgi:hypothetical protein
MRRLPVWLLAAGYTILAACSDSSMAPRVPAAAPTGSALLSRADDRTTDDFTIHPNGNSVTLFNGLATIDFPKDAVCDPATSGYGDAYWDAPCDAIGHAIRVSVTRVVNDDGSVSLAFSPDLRFNPATNVILSTDQFREYIKAKTASTRLIGLPYIVDLGSSPIHDTDVNIDTNSGRVWRRIKHFTGYNIQSGERCKPEDGDPDCVEVGGEL